MTIKTNYCGIEIELKAKGLYGQRNNKKDLYAVLNYFSTLAGRAADEYRNNNLDALADQAEKTADIFYDICYEAGEYEGI